jgi:hypothetical protein
MTPALPIEPVITYATAEQRIGRNSSKVPGDAANALATVGHNFRRILVGLAMLWRVFIIAVLAAVSDAAVVKVGDPPSITAAPQSQPRPTSRSMKYGRSLLGPTWTAPKIKWGFAYEWICI